MGKCRVAGDELRERCPRILDCGALPGRGPWEEWRYRMMRPIESARSAPMTILKILSRRRSRRTCWMAAPNASQRKQAGNEARMKRPPREAACAIGWPASPLRKAPAALALTSQDFGLTH